MWKTIWTPVSDLILTRCGGTFFDRRTLSCLSLIHICIVDETGKVLCKGEQSVNFDGYQTPVLDTVRKAAKEFLTAQAIPCLLYTSTTSLSQ